MSDSLSSGSGASEITAQFRSATVRIFNQRDAVVGAGVLVAERHLVTCAHVVAGAFGTRGTDTDPPDGEIQLDFPLLAPGQRLGARVVAWRPERTDEGGDGGEDSDIAVLELVTAAPHDSAPARLTMVEDLWGHRFRAFGFPARYNGGTWASGELRAGGTDGRVLIEDTKQTGFFIQPGFSGGPVWDEIADGVVGIAVTVDGRADLRAAFIISTAALVRAWPELGERAAPPCPYRGLFAFREQDAPFFFGREEAVEQIEKAVRGRPLVVVIGASGSGKSSVVYAGLLPRLRPEGSWLIAAFRPGDRPFHNLAAALVPLIEADQDATDQLIQIGKLSDALEQGHVLLTDTVAMILDRHPESSRLLLIADQFEELYAPGDDRSTQERFLDQMLAATEATPHQSTPSFGMVLTMRADFYGHALSYRPFADALQGATLNLGPMSRRELEQTIEEPARKVGVRLEEGLTERILDAVGSKPGDLPLLEFSLTQLWDHQVRGRLTHDAYEAIGGVIQALSVHADRVLRELSPEARARAQHVFVQLVQPGQGTVDTRRQALHDEIGEQNWDLVSRLATSRLVVSNERLEEREQGAVTRHGTVEIVHEALIAGWPQLREWIEQDRQFRMWQERLRAAERQWAGSKHDGGALLRGFLLAEAEQWQRDRESELTDAERAFIEASAALERRDREAERRRRRWVISGLAGGLAVALVLLGLAYTQWQRSEVAERNTLEALQTVEGERNAAVEARATAQTAQALVQLGSSHWTVALLAAVPSSSLV